MTFNSPTKLGMAINGLVLIHTHRPITWKIHSLLHNRAQSLQSLTKKWSSSRKIFLGSIFLF